MRINADFSQRAVLTPDEHEWVSSPGGEVQRVMLDRIGDEVARATSIVRYAPGSSFPHHMHPEGEEILVLAGTFSEGSDHYPAGWYMRSPPGSGHTPYSHEGATIFVKLRQMPAHEQQFVRLNTNDTASWRQNNEHLEGPLFSSDYEEVCLRRAGAGRTLLASSPGGAELLVVQGSITLDDTTYATGSWLRFPPGDTPSVAARPDGATVYLKTGHLAVPE